MCGRAAQTVQVAQAAATALGVPTGAIRVRRPSRSTESRINGSTSTAEGSNSTTQKSFAHNSVSNTSLVEGGRDNYNMSPGMDASVIWIEDGELRVDQKVWGLVTKGGSMKQPLPSDRKERMGMHFAGLMFNARTDTLFSKPTFSRLAKQGRSCVVALDGYFEWKASPLGGGKGKKQPYFVHRKRKTSHDDSSKPDEKSLNSCPYLLLAGLWTRVPTGLSEEPFLDTFTILTTEACTQIKWLHHRMPVCVWDFDLAKQWLQNPSPELHEELDKAAKANNDGFAWHLVTTDMSSIKFRGKEAIQAKKAPRSVIDFFSTKSVSTPAQQPTKDEFGGIKSGVTIASSKDHRSTELKSAVLSNQRGQMQFSSPKKTLSLHSSQPLSPRVEKRKIPSFQDDIPTKRLKPSSRTNSKSPEKGLITSFFRKK